MWTTVPVDLLTPLQLLGFNDYNWLLLLNSFGFLVSAFFLMLHITKNHLTAVVCSLLVFTSAWTVYFLPYYIHTTSFISAVLCLLALLKYSESKKGLIWIVLASLLGTLGSKLELSVYNAIFFFVSAIFFCGRQAWKPLLAYAFGVALNAGSLAIVLNAYSQSYRAGTFDTGMAQLLKPEMWSKFLYHLAPWHWTSETEDLDRYLSVPTWTTLGLLFLLLIGVFAWTRLSRWAFYWIVTGKQVI